MSKQPDLLFGVLALERGWVTRGQIQEALDEQRTADLYVPLGEVLRRRGVLSANQVRSLLDAQHDVSPGDTRTSLGSLAIRNGLVSPDRLDAALTEQKESSSNRLGEILCGMGALAPQDRDALLQAQKRLREGPPDFRDEIDCETRQVPAAGAPPDVQEPGAWLIQESGEGTGELFHLSTAALLGRTAVHDVAVADMAASRDHARIEFVEGRFLITDLDSRNGTFVNGAQLVRPRPLRSGDRIRVGDTLFRFVESRNRGLSPVETATQILRSVPPLHPERRSFALAAAAGMLTIFLPWSTGVAGLRSPWAWTAVLLFEAALVVSLLQDRRRPLPPRLRWIALGASSLAAAVALVRLAALAADPAVGAGLGLILAALAGMVPPLLAAFQRPPGKHAPAEEMWSILRGTALKAGESTVRLLKGPTPGDNARRDALLVSLGQAAHAAGVPGADGVDRALASLEAARTRRASLAAPTAVETRAADADLQWAELRLHKAYRLLGRRAVDGQVRLDGHAEAIADVRALDERLHGPARRRA